MRERGDLSCFHEPFMYDYYVNRKAGDMPHFEVDKSHPVTYEDIRDAILFRAQTHDVFIKDMSYYVVDRITNDQNIAPHLTNCFLIRNPLAAITSYAKLDTDLTSEEVGIEAQWRHFDALCTQTNTPTVLDADDIRANTEELLTLWWKHIGLPPCEQAFTWDDDIPEDWKQVGNWHRQASTSKRIKPPDDNEREKQLADFINLAQRRPQLNTWLQHHQPFYDRLAAACIFLLEPKKKTIFIIKPTRTKSADAYSRVLSGSSSSKSLTISISK